MLAEEEHKEMKSSLSSPGGHEEPLGCNRWKMRECLCVPEKEEAEDSVHKENKWNKDKMERARD